MATSRSSEASKRVISETKRLYGDLLARPLDEKLLARPSFKLIQAITRSLITETRILRNVFNSSDFESENKTLDKRKRIDFVQKLIDFVANHKQPVVGCVAAKIVSGLESNKIHELLQSLAKVALAKVKDREPNRPATFTKQSRRSASPQKAPVVSDKALKTSGRRQFETPQQQVATSVVRDRRASPRTHEDPAARRSSGDNKSGVRSTSGSLSRNATPRVAELDANPVPKSSTSSGNGQTDDLRVSSQREANVEEFELAKTHTADSTNHSSSETRKLLSTSKQPSQQFPVTSESDISKHLPQLRANLRILNPVLIDINHLVGVLKNGLACDVNRM